MLVKPCPASVACAWSTRRRPDVRQLGLAGVAVEHLQGDLAPGGAWVPAAGSVVATCPVAAAVDVGGVDREALVLGPPWRRPRPARTTSGTATVVCCTPMTTSTALPPLHVLPGGGRRVDDLADLGGVGRVVLFGLRAEEEALAREQRGRRRRPLAVQRRDGGTEPGPDADGRSRWCVRRPPRPPPGSCRRPCRPCRPTTPAAPAVRRPAGPPPRAARAASCCAGRTTFGTSTCVSVGGPPKIRNWSARRARRRRTAAMPMAIRRPGRCGAAAPRRRRTRRRRGAGA